MILADLIQRRQFVYKLTVHEDRLQHRYGFVVLHRLFDVGMDRIEQSKASARPRLLLMRKADVIRDRFAAVFADNAQYVFFCQGS